MKMKKILTFTIVLLGIFCLTGCSKTKELEKALNELEQSSYTIEANVEMIMHVEYNGQEVDETVKMNMYLEGDQTQSYSVITANNEKVYSYSCIKDGETNSYINQNGYWEIVDIKETSTEITDMVDVEVKDVFKKEAGVWVGDVEKLTYQLNGELEDYFDELGLNGGDIKVTRYDIILVDGKLSSIYLDMFMSMEESGVQVEVTLKMPLVFTKIGETEVTIPEGLFD